MISLGSPDWAGRNLTHNERAKDRNIRKDG